MPPQLGTMTGMQIAQWASRFLDLQLDPTLPVQHLRTQVRLSLQ
jgi:hypothetical protein